MREREEVGRGGRKRGSTNTYGGVYPLGECTPTFRQWGMSRGVVGGMAGRFGAVENGVGGRRHVARTPSRRRLRLRGAYQPPSIISMQISIFYPVFPKFMQTSSALSFPPPPPPPPPLVALVLSLLPIPLVGNYVRYNGGFFPRWIPVPSSCRSFKSGLITGN